jgi:hypothetical protein
MRAVRVVCARRLGARGLASWGKATPVQMPALSPTMTAGKIAKWSKKPGGERPTTGHPPAGSVALRGGRPLTRLPLPRPRPAAQPQTRSRAVT